MKYFVSLIIAVMAFSSHVFAESIEAPGKIVYKMPSGELVTRDVALSVPARGEGDVILRGSNSDLVATDFFTKESHGQILFFVVFKDFPGAQEGEISVFKGTYLRGSNKAYYYGDVYVGEEPGYSVDSNFLESHPDRFKYVAGFMFSASVQM